MRLTRRHLIATTPLLLLPTIPARAAPALPPGNTLHFSVWRNGSRIGAHSVDLIQTGDKLTVHSTAHFEIGFGPIKFYTYAYDVTEMWDGGVLQRVNAHTNDNGEQATCTCSRSGGALTVTGSKSGRYLAPQGSIAGTHWNKAELQAPIVNPENGVLMTFNVADKGANPPPGGTRPASHFALTGFATLDLWYDAAETWVGLRALAKDKSVIEYHQA